MGPNRNKVLHFYQSYCKYIAQIYTSKVYNVIYISGNTLDKRNTDFQEEEQTRKQGNHLLSSLSSLSITALSLYLVISPLASITCCNLLGMESDRVFSLFLGVPKHQSLLISSISIGLGWSRVQDGRGRLSHSGEGCLGWRTGWILDTVTQTGSPHRCSDRV